MNPGTKTLYLPESARPTQADSEVLREQRQMLEELERVTGKMNYFERELADIDPDLHLFMAKPNTTIEGVKPGYYHLAKEVPGVGTYIEPYEGPNGEWRDLDSGILDMARMADTWDDRVRRDIAEMQRKKEADRQAEKLRAGQERAAEFDERWKSHNNVSILVPRT